MPKSFFAVTPPQTVQFTLSNDQNVPIPRGGGIALPRTADRLVYIFIHPCYSIRLIFTEY